MHVTVKQELIVDVRILAHCCTKYSTLLKAKWMKYHTCGTYHALILQLILLDELLVIKHNYEADKKRKKNEVRTRRKVEKQMYDAAPSFARKINEDQIKQFFEDLKAAKTKNRPMLIDFLEGNECKLIVTQDITPRENGDNVLKDHDYCCHSHGKRQNETGDADSGIELPCKIIKMESAIEPLDTNFDNRFFLSHCEAVQVDAPDSERYVTEDDNQ